MLYYHKCDHCLTAFTTEERVVDFCDCNGTVTFMGIVKGDSYVKTENRPPCDGRCTHAAGPHCDCMCGGVNHGSGKLVPVVVKEGKVYATNLKEEDVERAHVYRQVRDTAQAAFDKRYGETHTKIQSRTWIDRPEYVAYINATRTLEKANGLRQHWPRIKALADFIAKNK